MEQQKNINQFNLVKDKPLELLDEDQGTIHRSRSKMLLEY